MKNQDNRNRINFGLGTVGRDMMYNLVTNFLLTYILFTKVLSAAQLGAITAIENAGLEVKVVTGFDGELGLLKKIKEHGGGAKGCDVVTGLNSPVMVADMALEALETQGEPILGDTHFKRFAAIGFIAGGVLMAGIYILAYLLGGRLHAAGEITNRYGVPVYGAYASHRARNPKWGIDKLLDKWEFAGQVTDPDVITANICALMKENYASKRVLVAGDMPAERLQPTVDRLRRGVDGAVMIDAAPDFLRDSAAVVEAGKADGVILAAEKYRDAVRDIDRMAETLSIANAKVGGSVVL